MPSVAEKTKVGRVREQDWNVPITMYGCNKLYCEQLGRYYARHYKQLSAEPQAGRVDESAIALHQQQRRLAEARSDLAAELAHVHDLAALAVRQTLFGAHDDVLGQLQATGDAQAIAATGNALEQPIRRRQLHRALPH